MMRPIHTRRYHNTREAVWDAIRRLKMFTVAELAGEVAYDKNTILLYLKSLVKAGYLIRTHTKSHPEDRGIAQTQYQYLQIKDAIAPPRVRADGTEVTQGRGRRQMWQTMRQRTLFTLADLVAMSSTEEHPVAESEAEFYLRHLVKAGYVKPFCGAASESGLCVTKRKHTMHHTTFRLVVNSGPQAPMIQRVKQVYDPNTKQVVWTAHEEQ